MITKEVVFALIGSLLFKSAISASINYEPIKITVNENFNAQPAQVPVEFQPLEASVLHQGANFFFKPQLNLPQSFIPSHIEALMSLIQQHHHSCEKDASKDVVKKDKLIEILKPFMFPLSEISKEALPKKALEDENNFEIVKTLEVNSPALEKIVTEPLPVIIKEELKPITPDNLVIPEAPMLSEFSFNNIPEIIEKEVKKEESVILEEPTGEFSRIPEIAMSPIMEPIIINNVEPKLMTSELVKNPEAPILPSLSYTGIPLNVEEEIKKEETVTVEGQRGVFPTIPETPEKPIHDSTIHYVESKPIDTEFQVISEAPVLPPLSANDIKLIEDGEKFNKPTIVDVDARPKIQEYLIIPEAPVLPIHAIHDIPSIVNEEVKKEESIIFDESTGEIFTIPEITMRPITEPIINYAQSKVIASELANIPEAPVLPSILFDGALTDVEEKIKKEETVTVEGQRGVFPTIPETPERPIDDSTIHYVEPKPIDTEFKVISEAPVLPPLSANDIKLIEDGVKFKKPTIVDVDARPKIQEYLIIPEAPVLPLHAIHDTPSIVKEEVEKKESVIFDETTGEISTIPEIAMKPISEPIINDIETKVIASELANIPEAPVLPSFLFDGALTDVEEKIKKEETVTVEGQRGVFPTIPETPERPIDDSTIHYVEPKPIDAEFQVISEAPVLPPLSANDIKLIEDGVKFNKPTIVDVDARPKIQEYLIIPEAPVLPIHAIHDIPSIVKEEVKKEESIIFDESTGEVFTIPEITMRPITEPIINYAQSKVIASELANIPEAPILPSLSHKGIPTNVEEEIKKEETVTVEGQMGVFPTIPETPEKPIHDSTIHYVEPKPNDTEFQVIPEAPVLPPLSANDIKLIEDGVKFNKPIIVDVDARPKIQEYLVNPEAPVLPLHAIHDIPSIVKEEVEKKESVIFDETTGEISTIPEIAMKPISEPIINDIETKVIASDVANIPEAPVLPSILFDGALTDVEEKIKKEETVTVEGQRGVFPTIPETPERPIDDSTIHYVEPKPIDTEFQVISEAPVLPPLSANDIKLIEDGVKFNKPTIVDVDARPKIQEYLIIPEAPVLPIHAIHDIPSIVKEEVKKEESIIFDESTGEVFTIPEITMRPITEPIINYAQSKVIASELANIPEAPILPSLLHKGIRTNVEEEIKKEETVTVEGQRGVFPTIPETPERPIDDSTIHYVEPKPIDPEFQVIPEAPVLPPLSANDYKLIEDGVKFNRPTIVDVDARPKTQEYLVIPEAPVLPTLSLHNVPSYVEDEARKQASKNIQELNGVYSTITEISVRPIQEPIINFVEPKAMTPETEITPEAPVIPSTSLNGIPSFFEEAIKEEESVILQESTESVSIGQIPESIVNCDEPKSAVSKLDVIPEAILLPQLSTKGFIEEEVKIGEPEMVDVEPRPFILNHIVIPEAPVISNLPISRIQAIGEEVKIDESIKIEGSTGLLPSNPKIFARPILEPIISKAAESFALAKNIFPVAKEEIKIEIPILLQESIELFPPVAEISSGPTLEDIQEPEMTNSHVLDKVPQPNLEDVVTVKETLPPTIISRPTNNLGVFSYAPFVSQLSNHVSKTNKLTIAKPASLERFLLKKHPFRLPVTPFPKLSLNEMKTPKWGNKKQFLYPTSYAHDVVEKRIAPNMAFKKNAPHKRIKIYIRSQVPKGPSYL